MRPYRAAAEPLVENHFVEIYVNRTFAPIMHFWMYTPASSKEEAMHRAHDYASRRYGDAYVLGKSVTDGQPPVLYLCFADLVRIPKPTAWQKLKAHLCRFLDGY